jgi:hypothetical protein
VRWNRGCSTLDIERIEVALSLAKGTTQSFRGAVGGTSWTNDGVEDSSSNLGSQPSEAHVQIPQCQNQVYMCDLCPTKFIQLKSEVHQLVQECITFWPLILHPWMIVLTNIYTPGSTWNYKCCWNRKDQKNVLSFRGIIENGRWQTQSPSHSSHPYHRTTPP